MKLLLPDAARCDASLSQIHVIWLSLLASQWKVWWYQLGWGSWRERASLGRTCEGRKYSKKKSKE